MKAIEYYNIEQDVIKGELIFVHRLILVYLLLYRKDPAKLINTAVDQSESADKIRIILLAQISSETD